MKFADYYKRRQGKGHVSLRRSQVQNALNGSTTMQIWLGKQWLGQSDKQEITVHASEADEIDSDILADALKKNIAKKRHGRQG